MNGITACLQPTDIDLMLSGQMEAAELRAAEQHLSDCDDCRERIDRSIGPTEWWKEVGQSLNADDRQFSTTDGAQHLTHASHETKPFLDLLGPSDDPRMLGRIGSYEVSGVIGRGGMGVVFKAFDTALNRYAAIKLLSPHLAHSGTARQRFAREARAAAAVVDDHVMPIHSVSEWRGIPYIVMPYSRGVSLQKRLNDDGPLDVREILRIGIQTVKGLAAAHAQGIVHRDVKPANILLDTDVERVALVDFGLARAVDDISLTCSGTLAGTPQYMSPEQARAETVGTRSDLFSLGASLYAMCTGRPPFRADTSYGVLRRITDEEPKPIRELNPDIPAWLCGIIAKLMSKQPNDRYGSAREVAELLEDCLAHVQRPTSVVLPRSLSSLDNGNSAAVQNSRKSHTKGAILMLATLSVGLLALFLWPAPVPPDISGKWTGDGWGQVALTETKPGKYEGTYTDTFGRDSGKIQLKWSPSERRFNGSWGEGVDRYGKISVRRVDEEIRGAWTTNKKSKIRPGSPRLADLIWTRPANPTARSEMDKRLADLVNEFNRLMEQHRYTEAAAIGERARELAPDEPATRNMRFKAKFAEQLKQAQPNSYWERELSELRKFPNEHRGEDKRPHAVSPPTRIDVLRALADMLDFDKKTLTDLHERHPKNFRIIVEPVYDKLDPPRQIPDVGVVQLHRVRFKCTVIFTEKGDVKWPLPHAADGKFSDVVMVDADHLHSIETPSKSDPRSSSLPGIGKPARPIFGGRNPKTGVVEFNPQWAEPVRQMLAVATAIEVSSGGKSVRQDITKTVRGTKAQRLLGVVAALVAEGSVSWKPGVANVMLIRTDKQSREVADSLLPAAIDALTRPAKDAELKRNGSRTEREEVNQLRQVAIENLLSDVVHLYESARWFWELSMSMEEELDLRERSNQLAEEGKKLRRLGKLKEADAAVYESELLRTRAEQIVAERAADQQRREAKERMRDEAKQLASQIHVLKLDGKMREAADLERKLNKLLRAHDPDLYRAYDLRERVIDARTRGRHDVADKLEAERQSILKALSERYPQQSKSRSKIEE